MYDEGFLILRKVSNIQQTNNAPVKLFCPLPPQPGVRGKMYMIKKGGELEKRVIFVII